MSSLAGFSEALFASHMAGFNAAGMSTKLSEIPAQFVTHGIVEASIMASMGPWRKSCWKAMDPGIDPFAVNRV
jgi:hypothetical protein